MKPHPDSLLRNFF